MEIQFENRIFVNNVCLNFTINLHVLAYCFCTETQIAKYVIVAWKMNIFVGKHLVNFRGYLSSLILDQWLKSVVEIRSLNCLYTSIFGHILKWLIQSVKNNILYGKLITYNGSPILLIDSCIPELTLPYYTNKT